MIRCLGHCNWYYSIIQIYCIENSENRIVNFKTCKAGKKIN